MRALLGKRGPLTVAIIATVGGLALLTLFGILLFDDDSADGQATPTPFSQPFGTLPAGDPIIVSQSDSGTISMTVAIPARLSVGGRDFFVQPQPITPDGIWATATNSQDTAVWVYGSVINYVLGVLDTADNRALLERLAPGEQLVMVTTAGTTYTFAVSGREMVASGNREIFAQNMPGITLVLLGSDANDQQRTVVQGRYVVSETAPEQAGNFVELGETAQLDGLQVTVTGASFVYERPEIPAGFAYYLVDYQLQNTAAAPFDSGLLRLTLLDQLGNQYALNPIASQVGNFPILSGLVSSGQAVQATAGYQIPVGLSSPTLRWQVARTDTNAQIQVNIPFRGESEIAQQTVVSLQQAEVSLDGSSLLLVGQITNLGDQPLIIRDTSVRLESEGTVYLILSTNPGFPWVVSPGQTIPFSVTFQRPAGATAVFTVLNQPFQLSGLR